MIDIDKIAKRDALEIKEISDLATKFLIELNGDLQGLEVEEIIIEGDQATVTLSYFRRVSEPNQLQQVLGILGQRVHKRIIIDRKNTKITAMKDWAPERREAA